MKNTTDTYYYITNSQYSVSAITDDSGNIEEYYTYTPYGTRTIYDDTQAQVSTSIIPQDYGFTGRKLDDESGLHYFRARYYDDQLGRFIQRDPIGYVDGMNLYRAYFVVNGVDPSGEKNCTDDAGECCDCVEIKEVDLRVHSLEYYEMDPANLQHLVGHVFLKLPSKSIGFYPVVASSTPDDYFTPTAPIPGSSQSDDGHGYHESVTYKVCPKTMKILDKSITNHKNDFYQLGNHGARNCAGWALARLSDAGIKTPMSSTEPFLSPLYLKLQIRFIKKTKKG